MPFSRPTLTELRSLAAADINGALPGADALLRYSNLRVLGQVSADGAHLHFGYLDYIALQATPFTATGEYMLGWAALKSIVQKPATAAHGTVAFTGAPGALIPATTRLVRGDGAVYELTASVTLDVAGNGEGPVSAVVAGLSGDADDGTALVLANPIAGVTSTAYAAGDISGSTDVEKLDDVRTRMLQAYAAPARGGAEEDYRRWALEVPGVTRAWVQRNGMGAGTVIVRFMMDEARAVDGGFPQGDDGVAAAEPRAAPATGDQLIVANAIFIVAPTTALVFLAAPLQNTVDFTIAGLAGATTATRSAIEAAIAGVFFTLGEPGGSVQLSYIEAAIAAIPAAAGFVITAIVCSDGSVTPGTAGNITSDTGRLPVLGVTTWS